jgi:hypothetical protein
MYALAAAAAGAGVLVLTPLAEAKIVYTKAHQVIGLRQHYNLDLNHDGNIDFVIKNSSAGFSSGNRRFLYASGITTGTALNEAVGSVNKYGFLAAALKPGARIGGVRKFWNQAKMVFNCSGTECGLESSRTSGNWVNVTNRYLGLRFVIKGKVHYGWARLSVQYVRFTTLSATLTGYAYETIPGKSIVAGQTKGPDGGKRAASNASLAAAPSRASLGRLALGSVRWELPQWFPWTRAIPRFHWSRSKQGSSWPRR